MSSCRYYADAAQGLHKLDVKLLRPYTPRALKAALPTRAGTATARAGERARGGGPAGARRCGIGAPARKGALKIQKNRPERSLFSISGQNH